MNVFDAAHATVHAYLGGSESLAPRLGMSAALLRNKVNPNNDRNQLTLGEASLLVGLTGDSRILQALANEHGYQLAMVDGRVPDGSITDLTLDMATAMGDLARKIKTAQCDGVISERELREIERAGMSSMHTVMLLLRKLTAMRACRPVGCD